MSWISFWYINRIKIRLSTFGLLRTPGPVLNYAGRYKITILDSHKNRGGDDDSLLESDSETSRYLPPFDHPFRDWIIFGPFTFPCTISVFRLPTGSMLFRFKFGRACFRACSNRIFHAGHGGHAILMRRKWRLRCREECSISSFYK